MIFDYVNWIIKNGENMENIKIKMTNDFWLDESLLTI